MDSVDVVVIGGGQSGLSAGYFLRRSGLSYIILDGETSPGGAWQHAWQSLSLFSPASWSSIAGWPMPTSQALYPTRAEILDYLARYEQKYALHIARPVQVQGVRHSDGRLVVDAADGRRWRSLAVISASGTWRCPYIPPYEGLGVFGGIQLHSAQYSSPAPLSGLRVAIIGGGNSGAQILAEVSRVAETTWITERPPVFLPDDVDGRVLFERATERWRARQEGRSPELPGGFGDIVMVPSVRDARERGVLNSIPPPIRFTTTGMEWADGSHRIFDAVIWCTGFGPALSHLEGLGVINGQGRVDLDESELRSIVVPSVWLLGYGDWNGSASATLIGVTRYAREVVKQVQAYVADDPSRPAG
ncbi:ArsO family NAD(P)H-dependent flavin-containing monooxygenase [Stenotrophomonas forensis]|uniref:ArsO family NAD(P)H-dependent flavin-containing monooxygenase n=1 Tax=Stenotrophomonas forensis TaxID=2871169 RepID=A0ABY7XUS3_9GAMM|nr:ArsO family NAD(P)H-dependent flavin-containing monooxygenase [Stenotrophomonas sp. DFS-20110405]WDM61824.1 ArsO family NAD(P)H-dependent flavin-containing monooxygenase [Stenotrophomonas sp. DFS-20110405]